VRYNVEANTRDWEAQVIHRCQRIGDQNLTLEQWLLRWDPTNFSFTALVFVVLVATILFLWLKWWPWYTKEAWPAKQRADQIRMEHEARQEETRLTVMAGIRDTLIELKILVGQQGAVLEHLSRHYTFYDPDDPANRA
jgi:hypothetical protein